MDRIWILVADASYARLFEVGEDGDWSLLREFEHAESREQGQDLMANRPGKIQHRVEYDAKGTNPIEFKREHHEAFARELVHHLDQQANARSFDRLAVVAPPKFLGLLRELMPQRVKAMVSVELDKDYTTLRPEKMAELVPVF